MQMKYCFSIIRFMIFPVEQKKQDIKVRKNDLSIEVFGGLHWWDIWQSDRTCMLHVV